MSKSKNMLNVTALPKPLEDIARIQRLLQPFEVQHSIIHDEIKKIHSINNSALTAFCLQAQSAMQKILQFEESVISPLNKLKYVFQSDALSRFNETIFKISKRFKEHKDTCDAIYRLGFACAIHGRIGLYSKSEDDEEALKQVYNYAKSMKFEEDILAIIASEERLAQRYGIVKSATCLHRKGNYHVSCMISSSQIEGILQDCLEELGLIYFDGKYVYATGECGDICTGKNKNSIKLTGVNEKINHAKNKKALDDDFIDDMLNDTIDGTNPINKFRNKLMHGDCQCEPTEEESLKLLLWMFGVAILASEKIADVSASSS